MAETIADLFGGAIDQFLSEGTAIFGSIAELLEEQRARLSSLEQTVLYWLAIVREPVTLEELLSVLVSPLPRGQVLEAIDGLRRRSLIERGQRAGSFTLHSVVLEYVTSRLVTTASQEIQQGKLLRLLEHGLERAQAKEYVRQAQERLLLAPLLASLQSVYQGRAEVEGQLCSLLEQVRERVQGPQGYGPANLVALLRVLRGDLRGLDLSRLALRGVPCRGYAPGQRLYRDLRCHLGGGHKRPGNVLGGGQLAGRSAGVARGRPDLASGLAGACRHSGASPGFQPGRTAVGHGKLGWDDQTVECREWRAAVDRMAD